jgi:hypothetical protein
MRLRLDRSFQDGVLAMLADENDGGAVDVGLTRHHASSSASPTAA